MRFYKFWLVWTIPFFVGFLDIPKIDPTSPTTLTGYLVMILFAMLISGIYSLYCINRVLSLWDKGEKGDAFFWGWFGLLLAPALLTRLILNRVWPE